MLNLELTSKDAISMTDAKIESVEAVRGSFSDEFISFRACR
jgi:hypothetical protein